MLSKMGAGERGAMHNMADSDSYLRRLNSAAERILAEIEQRS
jgi:hypothetical protein